MRKILFYPNKKLRKKSLPVQDGEWGSSLKNLINEMYLIMDRSQGIGLAAPQIGIHKRILVYKTYGEDPEINQYLINPKIISHSGEILVKEGCLSLPGIFAKVSRFKEITVEAQSFEGETFNLTTKEFSSVIIQHENDHLYGKLFIDSLSDLDRESVLSEYQMIQE